MSWRPIDENTPKDSLMLFWSPSSQTVWVSGGWNDAMGNWRGSHFHGDPTHWQPAPPPPGSDIACRTCGGRGEIGGFDRGDNAWRTETCPECKGGGSDTATVEGLPPVTIETVEALRKLGEATLPIVEIEEGFWTSAKHDAYNRWESNVLDAAREYARVVASLREKG